MSEPPPSPAKLSTSRASLPGLEDEEEVVEVDLELDADSELHPPAGAAGSASRAGQSRPGKDQRKPARPAPASAPTPPARVGTSELRLLLADEPEMLEAGLSVYEDDNGRAVGVGYSTEVGTIDLLARDARNALVVVHMASRDAGESLVADVLQRVGWVRKHLGKGKREVRAIVLLEAPRDDLSYAAAAVADTVAFKTWRLTVGFDDLEV